MSDSTGGEDYSILTPMLWMHFYLCMRMLTLPYKWTQDKWDLSDCSEDVCTPGKTLSTLCRNDFVNSGITELERLKIKQRKKLKFWITVLCHSWSLVSLLSLSYHSNKNLPARVLMSLALRLVVWFHFLVPFLFTNKGICIFVTCTAAANIANCILT